MKLRSSITTLMIGPCCRMFELSSDHFSSCDGWFVSTSARLYIFFYGFQRLVDTLPMSNSYSLIITDERLSDETSDVGTDAVVTIR